MGWIQKVYIDQRSTHQGFFGLKGVRTPHKVEGHHEPSHIGLLIKLHQEKGKGRLLNRCPTDFSVTRKTMGKKAAN